MRYEFERDGRRLATVSWEGPAQVTVEVDDPAERARFDRFFGQEVVYLSASTDFGGAMGEGGLASRRRDWTPWEFERQVRHLARKLGVQVHRVETGPVEDRAASTGGAAR
jgi:hypothetical protein